jgi:hypothetical protein
MSNAARRDAPSGSHFRHHRDSPLGVRRRRAIAAAIAGAVAFAALLVAAPQRLTIPLGRPGDGPFLTGFGPRTVHRGLPGRWTGGTGRIDLPHSPLGAAVTLHLQPAEARAPEPVDVFLDGARVNRVDLAAGRQTVALRLPACALLRGCGSGGRVVVQSPAWVDAASGERRGLFVSRVVVERGWSSAPVATWAAALALALGIVAAALVALRSPPLALGAVAWAFAALFLFRAALSPWWPALAVVAWSAAAGGRFCNVRRTIGRTIGRTSGRTGEIAVFAIGAGALVGLLFAEVVTRGWVFGQPQMLEPYYPWRAYLPAAWEPRPGAPLGDVPMLVYPFLAFARERLLAGELPLWTATLNGGQPFLAAYQAAVFSPLTWTALLVPLPQATIAIAFLRLIVGGVGLYVFVRGLGLSRGAAVFAGTAYLLNPFAVIWLEHPPGGVPPFLPWMLHAATRAAEGRRCGAAGLAAATALVLLGGHPHTGLFCALFGSAWAAAAALARPERVARLATVAAALLLGAALAAIQIAPFLEYLFASRGYAWRQFAGLNPLSAPASTLIVALVPRFLGEHAADTYAGPLNFLEQTMYAGIPVLMLAVVGVAAPRRDWRALFFAATGVLAALAVYGAPGILDVISALPLVKGATLTRIPIVAITSAIVVAAFGVDALRAYASDGERRRATIAAGAAAAAIAGGVLIALAVQRSFLLRSLLTADTWRWSVWALLLAAATLAAVAAFARRRLSRHDVVVALVALVALDLLVFGRGLHPTQPAARVYPALPELTRLREDPGPFRVAGAQGALMPNSALVYGLQDIRAYDGLGVAAYADLLDVALAWAPAHQQHELHRADSPVLDLLGVRYLLAPPTFAVDAAHWERIPDTTAPLYRNRRERPRAFLADGYVVATGSDARRRLRDAAIEVRREAVLEADPATTDRPERAAAGDAVGTARITTYEHERVAIDTDAPGRRLLVLSDTWFPGWRATVDGAPVPIARANFAFRAVAVPAGRHQVVFTYAPTSFRIGATISGVALALLGVWTLVDERRQRRAPTLPASAV